MKALDVLLQRGRLRLVEAGERAYLRIEVYTSDTLELDALMQAYGGRVAEHNDYTRRWSIQKEGDLRRAANELFLARRSPALTLLAYLDLSPALARWAYLRETFERLGTRCIAFQELNPEK